MKALQFLCKTNDSAAPLLARLTLGLVMFPHGAQKALGWFGGYGYTGTKDVNLTLETLDQFGSSVALNAAGDRMAVGTIGDDGYLNSKLNSGAVFLYTFTDTSFAGGAQAAAIGNSYGLPGGRNVTHGP